MKILVSGSKYLIQTFGNEHVGGLVTPQSYSPGSSYNRLGACWAMDNDCFVTLKRVALTKMWRRNQPFAKSCLWAAVPDVVGDARKTLERFIEWGPVVKSFGYPLAYVAQDGIENTFIPWHDFHCLFIGGSTEFKIGEVSRQIVAEAKCRGKRIHMGRVNSIPRLKLALDWGCDTVDGTGFSRNGPKHLPWAIEIIQKHSPKLKEA